MGHARERRTGCADGCPGGFAAHAAGNGASLAVMHHLASRPRSVCTALFFSLPWLLAASCSSASAQTIPTADTVNVELEPIIVTANRTPTPGQGGRQRGHGDYARGVGAAADPASLSEALRSVPGVAVNRTRHRRRPDAGPHSRLGRQPNAGLHRRHRGQRSGRRQRVRLRASSRAGHRTDRSSAWSAERALRLGRDRRRRQHHHPTRRRSGSRVSGFAEGGSHGTAARRGVAQRCYAIGSTICSARAGLRTDGFSSARGMARQQRETTATATAPRSAKIGFQALDNLRFDFVGARRTDYDAEETESRHWCTRHPTERHLPADGSNSSDAHRRSSICSTGDGSRCSARLGPTIATTITKVSRSAISARRRSRARRRNSTTRAASSSPSDALPEVDHTFTFAAEHEKDEAPALFLRRPTDRNRADRARRSVPAGRCGTSCS